MTSRMKCTLCEDEYREKLVVGAYQRNGRTVVIADVPALVCDRCGDVLLREETVSRIRSILSEARPADEFAPVFRFSKVA